MAILLELGNPNLLQLVSGDDGIVLCCPQTNWTSPAIENTKDLLHSIGRLRVEVGVYEKFILDGVGKGRFRVFADPHSNELVIVLRFTDQHIWEVHDDDFQFNARELRQLESFLRSV